MSEMTVAPPQGAICPRITEMLPWQIWVAPRSIGSTDEESRAISQGQVDLTRTMELHKKTQIAFEQLRDVVPPGVQFWMTMQRARN